MSEQLFEEAKRELARYLLEKHSAAYLGWPNRIRKKLQAVRVTERQVLNQFYGAGERPVLQRYARTLELDPQAMLHTPILKRNPPLRRDRPLLSPENTDGQVLVESIKINRQVKATNSYPEDDAEKLVATWLAAKDKVLNALKNEELLSRRGDVILISPRQAKRLSEFLRKSAS